MPGSRSQGTSRRNRRYRGGRQRSSVADRGMSMAGSQASSNSAMLESPSRWPKASFVNFPGNSFPDQLRLRVKYNETVAFSGALSPASQNWAVSSISHVNSTSSTGNPSYYNALGTIYKRYCVVGFEGIIEVASSMTSGSGMQWAAQACDFVSGSKSTIQIREGKWATGGTVGIVGTPTIQRRKFPYLTANEVNGQSNILSDPNIYTAFGSDPTDNVFVSFRASSNDGTNNASGVVRVTFWLDLVVKELVDTVT